MNDVSLEIVGLQEIIAFAAANAGLIGRRRGLGAACLARRAMALLFLLPRPDGGSRRAGADIP